MLPFSKRPPPPDEYSLHSGDFAAVNPPSRDYGPANQQDPAAPRAPVFARHAAPSSSAPCGFSQQPYQHQQQQPYSHYADLSAPPPPHSLAPVAMGSERTHSASVSTGLHRAQTVVIRQKPSLKLGVMIALTGALLGGVLGLGMDAKRQQARATAAAEARDAVPMPPIVVAAVPSEPAVNGINATPAAPAAPAVAPAPLAVVAPPPVVLAPSPPVAVTFAKPEPATKPEKHAITTKSAPVKHPTFVAPKVPAPKAPPPEKAEAPAKPSKAEKPEKPEPAKSAPSDARKVLEDAIKDTTNTL